MIEGRRIRLWALEKFDVSRNYQWGNDPELICLTGMTPYPKSLTDLERWFESVHMNPNQKLFTIKLEDGEYIGNIDISNIDWRAGHGEVGIILGEKGFQGHGYGREALALLTEFAFSEMRLHRLEARVLGYNTRAQHLFERAGFVREGLLREQFYQGGRYVDVVCYSLLASDSRPGGATPSAPESGKDD